MHRAFAALRKPSKCAGVGRRYCTPAPPCQKDVPRFPQKCEFVPEATMNDLPSPHGSWSKKNEKLQLYYNKVFIGGLAFLLMSIGAVYATFDFYLSPPEKPAPRP